MNRQELPSQDPTTSRLGRVVTPMGRALRRFSIAARLQLIDVLRREMSVVGPRSPLRREVEASDDDD
jgi:lipopolysaccharide/colanic/teichoic acid biosynthesis glycosyltransferase